VAKIRVRIDVLLVEQGHFPSRERAQAALMAGVVMVNGARVDKAGQQVAPDVVITIAGPAHPYVSRGGVKLAHALDEFGWPVAGLRAVDLGASTGGFSDCLLQRGVSQLLAVDVGKGQLDLKVASDPRVSVLDKTNARYLRKEELPWLAEIVTVDVSFISLSLMFPVIVDILAPEGRAVALIKPQFEAGAANLRKGVVKSAKVHQDVLDRVHQMALDAGLRPLGLAASPLRGPAGNIEFVAGFDLRSSPQAWASRQVVEAAHAGFSPA